MPKLTLLQMTQDILNDMDSDEVNSIDDTIESQQVAQIIKTTYNEIIDSRYWSHLKKLLQLDASGDSTKPVWMKIPEGVQEVLWIKYNKIESGETRNRFEDVLYKDPEDFLELVMSRDNTDSNVGTFTGYDGLTLPIRNDRSPSYWTSFDDEYIVFDSYDSGVDTTLQSSKSMTMGYKEASFTLSDSFIPDLPANVFSYLLSESKSVAFNAIKQAPNSKEEQRSRRQRTWTARKNRTREKPRYPNYGRK